MSIKTIFTTYYALKYKNLVCKWIINIPKDRVRNKVTVHPRTGHEGPEGEYMYSSIISSTSALAGDGWLTLRPGRFTPRERSPVPIVHDAKLIRNTVKVSNYKTLRGNENFRLCITGNLTYAKLT